MAIVTSYNKEKIEELMSGWEGVSLRQDDIDSLISQLQTEVGSQGSLLQEFQNVTVPNLLARTDAASELLDNFLTNDLPALQADILANTNAIESLGAASLAELETRLHSAELWILDLNETTLPQLYSDLSANQTVFNEFNTVTLPTLNSRLDEAGADVATLEGKFPIDGPDIKANAITANKIAADTITSNEIAANAITAAEIAADAVTANKIAADAVTASKIAAGAVTAAKIAANTITANEIATDAITADEIAAEAVTALEIAANAVTAVKINAGAVTSSKVAAEAITAEKIAVGAITADKIAAGAVTADTIAANAIDGFEISGLIIDGGEINGVLINAGEFRTSTDSGIQTRLGNPGNDTKLQWGRIESGGVFNEQAYLRYVPGAVPEEDVLAIQAEYGIGLTANNQLEVQVGSYSFSATDMAGGRAFLSAGADGFEILSYGPVSIAGGPLTIEGGSILTTSAGSMRLKANASGGSVGNLYLESAATIQALPVNNFEVRCSDSAGFFIVRTGGDNVNNTIYGRADGTVVFARHTTTTATANMQMTTSGVITRSTSVRDAKLMIKPIPEEHLERLMDLEVVSWIDRAAAEDYAAQLEGEEPRTDTTFARIPGLVAEDVEASGATEFVTYGPEGELTGVAYDRIGVAWIPLVKKLMRRVDELEARL